MPDQRSRTVVLLEIREDSAMVGAVLGAAAVF